MPWIVYAVVLFAFSGILFAVHVPQGTFLHSAVALVPHAYLLAVIGIGVAVRWVAARRPSWDAPRATRNFTVIVVARHRRLQRRRDLARAGHLVGEEALRRPIAEALARTRGRRDDRRAS